MSIAGDLIRGHTDAIILARLLRGDSYGYEINKVISTLSAGRFELKEATLYTAFKRLEELGYIVQPHTSAGRIPSDKGYRFYVDNLMEEKEREVSEMKDFVIERTAKMEQVLKQVVKLLANNTNYATMITAPQYQQGKLKFIQLSQVDEEQLLAVIVLEGNIVKNKIIRTDLNGLDNEQLLKLNLNKILKMNLKLILKMLYVK